MGRIKVLCAVSSESPYSQGAMRMGGSLLANVGNARQRIKAALVCTARWLRDGMTRSVG